MSCAVYMPTISLENIEEVCWPGQNLWVDLGWICVQTLPLWATMIINMPTPVLCLFCHACMHCTIVMTTCVNVCPAPCTAKWIVVAFADCCADYARPLNRYSGKQASKKVVCVQSLLSTTREANSLHTLLCKGLSECAVDAFFGCIAFYCATKTLRPGKNLGARLWGREVSCRPFECAVGHVHVAGPAIILIS